MKLAKFTNDDKIGKYVVTATRFNKWLKHYEYQLDGGVYWFIEATLENGLDAA